MLVDPLPATGRRGAASPWLLLHGFAGQPEAWDPVVEGLEGPFVRVRLPGHGLAPEGMQGGFDDAVDALAAELSRPCRVAGYSMGARLALGLAVRHPHLVTRLLLVGVNPGLEGDRRARQTWDDTWADRIEREGMAAFERAWAELPLFASQRALPSSLLETQRAARLAHRPAALAWAMRHLGLGRMPSRWAALPHLTIPTLIATGAQDPKYRDLTTRIAALNPTIRTTTLPDSGHNPLLETPIPLRALFQR